MDGHSSGWSSTTSIDNDPDITTTELDLLLQNILGRKFVGLVGFLFVTLLEEVMGGITPLGTPIDVLV